MARKNIKMIVENIGYRDKNFVYAQIENNVRFGIYNTNRGSQVLVLRPEHQADRFWPFSLYTWRRDKEEWTTEEDRRILDCVEKVFDHLSNPEELDTSMWNGGKQIITYQYPQRFLI